MKVISPALAAHLASGAHTMATCWRVQRTDDRVFGFTSHDEAFEFEGVVYVASAGMNRSAIESQEGLQVPNANATGFLSGDAITDDDLAAGVWDFAAVRVFQVNWRDLTMGALKELRGNLGEFTLQDDAYTAELRGLTDAFNNPIGQLVTPGCTATVGDARCTVDLTPYTASGTVVAADPDRRAFDTDLSAATVQLTPTTTGAPPDGYFDAGLLTWLTGANAGRRAEVKTFEATGPLELQLPMFDVVAAGDTFSVSAGCAKSRAVCSAEFGNIVNFRGFPDLPGIDRISQVGGQT